MHPRENTPLQQSSDETKIPVKKSSKGLFVGVVLVALIVGTAFSAGFYVAGGHRHAKLEVVGQDMDLRETSRHRRPWWRHQHAGPERDSTDSEEPAPIAAHLEAHLATALLSQGKGRGSGHVTVDVAGDLESITVHSTWEGITGEITGIHIHEPDLLLKVVFLCMDELVTPCTTTVHRGHPWAEATMEWDTMIDKLLGNEGLFIILHTTAFPYGELTGTLFLDDQPIQLPMPECPIAIICGKELITCLSDPMCLALTSLYNIGKTELSTPISEARKYFDLTESHPAVPLAQAYFDCQTACTG